MSLPKRTTQRASPREHSVVLLRGLSAAPWDLHPYERLAPDYSVTVLVPRGNLYDLTELELEQRRTLALSDLVPRGSIGRLLIRARGERFLRLGTRLREADIVHVAELGNWYSAQAARLKARFGFKLVVSAWETLPLRDSYRNLRTRPYARDVIRAGDRFLPATERARDALLLEGVSAERTAVCPPGIELERFATARTARPPDDGSHLILSVGRLVWEKGHQDLLRALALLRRDGRTDVRALIVGDGPERGRLQELIADLELSEVVELRPSVPYEQVPGLYAQASCLVLASLPTRFWEEQFGMVLAEAMAGHLPVVASTSGAIPEVLGDYGHMFSPGDWVGLGRALAVGPLAGAPGQRTAPATERVERFSADAAASRLRAVYEELSAV
jgi:glycosyltransferase involved in cell wall biosynthesis